MKVDRRFLKAFAQAREDGFPEGCLDEFLTPELEVQLDEQGRPMKPHGPACHRARLLAQGLPERFVDATWADFDDQLQTTSGRRFKQVLMQYIRKFDDSAAAGRQPNGLIVLGSPGAGKTLGAVLIAKSIGTMWKWEQGKVPNEYKWHCWQPYSVAFITAKDLLELHYADVRLISQSKHHDAALRRLYLYDSRKRLANVDLLVLDDLGGERPTDFAEKTVENLLRRRSGATVITSSLDLADIDLRYPLSMADYLGDVGLFVGVDAEDDANAIVWQR